ncbi:MAG TPA: flavodoxin family protein [Candidatus Enterenecus merdae]|nr:flavodoxin family protein [Candidatus Enterenecus merdae]
MNVLILMGSPRRSGNTAQLLSPFQAELEAGGHVCQTVWLYGLDLRGCTACRACQRDWSTFGCPQGDDMGELFDQVLACDLLVLATPIYSWFCTPPMKAVLDRLVYGMNKYYGGEKGPALWAGKPVALVTTCGYRPATGADLWEEGMRRYCKHSQLRYLGMLAERHLGYGTVFMDESKAARARAFAASLLVSAGPSA